jgi:tRNA modification GTPase
MHFSLKDTICAIATPEGAGALAIVRISGPAAVAMADAIFTRDLKQMPANSASYGWIRKGSEVVDEAIAVLFKAPQSFTGDDTVEFTLHGSPYIRQRVLELLINEGAQIARAGEFSMRAFVNGKLDLAQAEAIADLIASESEASHQLAIKQLRGGFSKELTAMREKLIEFAALVELELDFGEEDVEFANRDDLRNLVIEIRDKLKLLSHSFKLGNAIKKGIPVAITGAPNVGKSTLLNALLGEEKALVSEIAGTTRDAIEDRIAVEGVEFRFIDTAGIRETQDVVEKMGIERSLQKIDEAQIVLVLTDPNTQKAEEINHMLSAIPDEKFVILLGNKSDAGKNLSHLNIDHNNQLSISALQGTGLPELKTLLVEYVRQSGYTGNEILLTNVRHYEALSQAVSALDTALNGMEQKISSDLFAMDIRQAMHYMGEVTGQICTDDLLGYIFGRFCIGK